MSLLSFESKKAKRIFQIFEILALMSGIALIVCGSVIAQPVLDKQNFEETTCVVTGLQQGGNRTCSSSNSGTSFTSEYPCSVVLVTYDVLFQNDDFSKVSSALYYARNMVGAGCSFIPACFENPEINFAETESFLTFYGQLGTIYTCYYNPNKFSEVIILLQYSYTAIALSLAIPGGVFALCLLVMFVAKHFGAGVILKLILFQLRSFSLTNHSFIFGSELFKTFGIHRFRKSFLIFAICVVAFHEQFVRGKKPDKSNNVNVVSNSSPI